MDPMEEFANELLGLIEDNTGLLLGESRERGDVPDLVLKNLYSIHGGILKYIANKEKAA